MSVLLDEETVVLEGLDFAPTCSECDATATRGVRCRWCLDVEPFCAEHAQKLIEAIEQITAGGLVVHDECKHHSASVDEAVEVIDL